MMAIYISFKYGERISPSWCNKNELTGARGRIIDYTTHLLVVERFYFDIFAQVLLVNKKSTKIV